MYKLIDHAYAKVVWNFKTHVKHCNTNVESHSGLSDYHGP